MERIGCSLLIFVEGILKRMIIVIHLRNILKRAICFVVVKMAQNIIFYQIPTTKVTLCDFLQIF